MRRFALFLLAVVGAVLIGATIGLVARYVQYGSALGPAAPAPPGSIAPATLSPVTPAPAASPTAPPATAAPATASPPPATPARVGTPAPSAALATPAPSAALATPAPSVAPATPAPSAALATRAPSVAPATPTPAAAAATAAPAAGPQILAIDLPSAVSGGSTISGTVTTTPDVTSVSAGAQGYSIPLTRIAAGRFGMSFSIPPVPGLFRGTYTVTLVARNGAGQTASRSFGVTLR